VIRSPLTSRGPARLTDLGHGGQSATSVKVSLSSTYAFAPSTVPTPAPRRELERGPLAAAARLLNSSDRGLEHQVARL
jgi:hypothetical protein